MRSVPYEIKYTLYRGKMADELFVVASEKYGSGSLERKYRFSAENGNVERIGRKRETIGAFLKKFFKVIFYCRIWVYYKGGIQDGVV